MGDSNPNKNSYKDLIVWRKALDLVKAIYLVTADFPETEKFGLVSQMRRAAVSIPSNIAEGSKRKSKNDYIQFLRIASGSAAELETQIIISKELYPKADFANGAMLLIEVQKMLSTIIRKLEIT